MTAPTRPPVTIRRASELLGLTEKAIRRKIEDGKWVQGRQWHRAPDGGIFIDIEAVCAWITGAPQHQPAPRARAASPA